MEKYSYREAKISDAAMLVEIVMKARLEKFAWDDLMQEIFRKSDTEAIPRLMKQGTLVVFLVYQGKTLVGMGGLMIWQNGLAKGSANLYLFYVEPECRGRGIMRHLLHQLILVAKKNDVSIIKTCETENNRQRLHHLGFKDIYDQCEDEEQDDELSLSDEMQLVVKDVGNLHR